MNQKLTYEVPPTTGWRGFWDRGGFWKAALAAIVYIALYEGFAFLLLRPIVADVLDTSNAFASATNVLLGLALPVIFGSVVLVLFGLSIGWFPRPLFGAQPVRGRWWMWIAPFLVLIPIVFHLIGTDYSRYTPAVVVSTLFAGLFIGFAEEVLCRGFVVGFLRRHGYKEWAVMALSSLVFGILHSSNVLGGQDPRAVVVEVLYAIPFGVCMYLTLRVTGNLIWPILLHAFTDPTTALASGGIDETVAGTSNTALTIAVVATFAYVGFALIGVICTRGHAEGRAEAHEGPRRASVSAADEDTQPTIA
ncbi:CPBP family intramembrane glutamic endopeptidase [Curtobacterium sp. PhB115]|uniref:CPBP family intramembrane glutamic endopeptidase n=1 Tax=Curtobacterium sp. PhB115 TaxID=2485173 RepID=UPI000F4B4251|nr:type II CAAX endopeptidase family protein [Curtobacterium sp. PhB115]